MAESKLPEWMVGKGLETDMSTEWSSSENDRLWIPPGEEKEILILTEGDASPTIWEHQLQINGNWRHWATCVQMIGLPCKLCQYAEENEGKFRRYKAQYFSALDLTGWKDKKGNWHRNNRVMIPAKKDTCELLKRRYLTRLESGEGLKGAKFKVYRSTSKKAAAVGSEWEFLTMVDLDDFENTEEHDFVKVLAPDPDKVEEYAIKLGFGLKNESKDGKVAEDEVEY